MKRYITSILLMTTTLGATAQYRPDILGEGFEQLTIEQRPDYSGELCATLVRRTPRVDSTRAILYIHGYNDYFFQREMAERFTDSLYNFYALDLRKYGRSYREGQQRFEVREIAEYFEDIDAAIEQIRSEGIESIILMAHSTGGLTTSLYCESKESLGVIDGMILNSPFFDMNLGGFTESILVPIVSAIGDVFPNLVIFKGESTAYYESLDCDHHGEWSYDTTMKLKNLNPTTAGWIRAIHRGQKVLQRGLNIEIPILLIYSDRSFTSDIWQPEFQFCDTVLDVSEISRYGDKIGDNVTHAEIAGGMHDIVLSGYKAREQAYKEMFEWLESIEQRQNQ